MPLYAARWLNDSFSLLSADSQDDALNALNDVSDTTQCELFGPLDTSLFLDFKKDNDPLLDIAQLDIWADTRRKKKELQQIQTFFAWERREEWIGEKVRDWVNVEITYKDVQTEQDDDQSGQKPRVVTTKLDKTLYKMLAKRPQTEFNETIRVTASNASPPIEHVLAILMKPGHVVLDDGSLDLGADPAPATTTNTKIPRQNNVDDRPSRRSGRTFDPNHVNTSGNEPPAKRRRIEEDTRTKYTSIVRTYENAFALAHRIIQESELCSNIHTSLMEDIKRYCDDFTVVSRVHSTTEDGTDTRHVVYEENWAHMLEFLDILEQQGSGLREWMFWNCYVLKDQAKSFAGEEDMTKFANADEIHRFVLSHEDNDGLPAFTLEADYSDPPLVSSIVFARRKDLYDADDAVKKKVLVKDKVLFRQLVDAQRERAAMEMKAGTIDVEMLPDIVGE